MSFTVYGPNGSLLVSDFPLHISASPWNIHGWREPDGTLIEEVTNETGEVVKRWVNGVLQEGSEHAE